MALSNLNTNWVNGSYMDDLYFTIKSLENPDLLAGYVTSITPYYDGSIAIGYGLDLLVNSA